MASHALLDLALQAVERVLHKGPRDAHVLVACRMGDPTAPQEQPERRTLTHNRIALDLLIGDDDGLRDVGLLVDRELVRAKLANADVRGVLAKQTAHALRDEPNGGDGDNHDQQQRDVSRDVCERVGADRREQNGENEKKQTQPTHEQSGAVLLDPQLNVTFLLVVFVGHEIAPRSKGAAPGETTRCATPGPLERQILGEEVTDLVDDRTNDVVVNVREGSASNSKLGEGRVEHERASAQEDADQEGAEEGALPATVGVTADAAGAAREEADASSRDHDGLAVEGNHESHGDEAAEEGADEADDDGVRGEREDGGAVNGRTSIGDELLGDADEGLGDGGDELTDTVDQDGHTGSELKASEERPDEPKVVAEVGREGLAGGELVTEVASHEAGDGHDVEQNNHEQGDGEHEVLEELEELGELLLLGLGSIKLAVGALLGEELAHVTGEGIADAVEVADGDGVIANELVDEGLAERREGGAAEAEDDATEKDGDHERGAQGDEDEGEDAGEVQEVLTSQEDGLELRELSEDQVHDEAQDHDHGDLGAIGLESERGRNLDLGHNAGDLEGTAEHVRKDGDLGAHGAGADVEDHKANHGLNGTGEDVHRGLLLQQETDEGDDAHNHRRVPELCENGIKHVDFLSAGLDRTT